MKRSWKVDAELEQLHTALASGTPVELESAAIDDKVQEKVAQIIHRLLGQYDRMHLADTVVPCTIELAINAAKANGKNAYFEQNNWDLNDAERYPARLQEFKRNVVKGERFHAYCEETAGRGFLVRITFKHSPAGLLIEVWNNRPLILEDERRIQMKFSQVQQYQNLMDLHRDHGSEDDEGEGLGIALSFLLLKAENIPLSLFRISSEGANTVARIEVPF
jgi:hypothetical protein